jgi:hypothetical protein
MKRRGWHGVLVDLFEYFFIGYATTGLVVVFMLGITGLYFFIDSLDSTQRIEDQNAAIYKVVGTYNDYYIKSLDGHGEDYAPILANTYTQACDMYRRLPDGTAEAGVIDFLQRNGDCLDDH